MTSRDTSLSELIKQFAHMPPEDRAEVLASLSEEECARLLPMLSDGSETSLSPALSALVGLCRIDAARGVTRRVSAILAECAPPRMAGSAGTGMLVEARSGTWDRFAALWRKRA